MYDLTFSNSHLLRRLARLCFWKKVEAITTTPPPTLALTLLEIIAIIMQTVQCGGEYRKTTCMNLLLQKTPKTKQRSPTHQHCHVGLLRQCPLSRCGGVLPLCMLTCALKYADVITFRPFAAGEGQTQSRTAPTTAWVFGSAAVGVSGGGPLHAAPLIDGGNHTHRHRSEASNTALGIALTFAGTIVSSVQWIVEEKFLKAKSFSPLQQVGIEGWVEVSVSHLTALLYTECLRAIRKRLSERLLPASWSEMYLSCFYFMKRMKKRGEEVSR